MQAGPVKANDLFVRLSDTSDGAVKTREKLFAELKAELELHAGLEEQHLFPVLRRNAETKEIVTEAIKDNKELRAKLAELEALPKNDDAFPERLKALQKTFRQHARDEKRELLPAVQRALSEEQVQGIAQKIEAGVAEAELAKHDELEARRAAARQDRQEAEREAARQAEAGQAQKAVAEQARHDEAEQKRKTRQEREQAERRAEQEAVAAREQSAADHRAREPSETAARVAVTAQTNTSRVAETATAGTERVGEAIRDTVQIMTPDFQAAATLPSAAIGAMTEIRSAWMEWMGQTTRAGTQMSRDLMWQAAEQQQRFVTSAMQGWMERNARVMRITMDMTQTTFRPFDRAATRSRRDR
jgi:iron-sulfur cluster repair protein YtfE (RIC family)